MQRFIASLIILAAIPFAIYVWPTKYAYDHIKLGESQFPVRIHRVTGVAEQLTQIGWIPLKPAPSANADSFGRPLTQPSPDKPPANAAPTRSR